MTTSSSRYLVIFGRSARCVAPGGLIRIAIDGGISRISSQFVSDRRRLKIERPGHWEGDLLSGPNNSYIATLVERHTRYVMLAKVAGNGKAFAFHSRHSWLIGQPIISEYQAECSVRR